MAWLFWLFVFMLFALRYPAGAVYTVLGAWYCICFGLIVVPAVIILVSALAEILQ